VNDKDALKKYARGVIRNLKPNLRKDINITLTVHPSQNSGGVVEVILSPHIGKIGKGTGVKGIRGINIRAAKGSVNEILKTVPQNFIGGSLDGVTFEGTNISMENNRIVFIKGDNEHWKDADAKFDIEKIIDLKAKR
jgi:hypothetical protein